jgi:hypothetical protein
VTDAAGHDTLKKRCQMSALFVVAVLGAIFGLFAVGMTIAIGVLLAIGLTAAVGLTIGLALTLGRQRDTP